MASLGRRLGLALLFGSIALPLSPAVNAAPANLTSDAKVQAVQYYYGHGYYGRPHCTTTPIGVQGTGTATGVAPATATITAIGIGAATSPALGSRAGHGVKTGDVQHRATTVGRC